MQQVVVLFLYVALGIYEGSHVVVFVHLAKSPVGVQNHASVFSQFSQQFVLERH